MLFGCGAAAKDYRKVHEAGFDYAELSCREVSSMSGPDFSTLCKTVEQAGLPVLAMNIYCPPEIVIAGPGYDLDTARDYACKAAKRAAALGVTTVGIGSPRSRILPEGFDHRVAQEQLAAFLSATADAFGAQGVNVCCEALGPCFCNFINTLDEAVAIVRRVNHPHLQVVLDFYNMEHAGEADMDLTAALPYIRHAHTSDDEGSPNLRSYLLPEKESVHLRRLTGLHRAGYTKTLTLELDMPVEVAKARASLAVMRRAWEG